MVQTHSAVTECWYCHETLLILMEIKGQKFHRCNTCGATTVALLPKQDMPILPLASMEYHRWLGEHGHVARHP